jgi:hypothetical protein
MVYIFLKKVVDDLLRLNLTKPLGLSEEITFILKLLFNNCLVGEDDIFFLNKKFI